MAAVPPTRSVDSQTKHRRPPTNQANPLTNQPSHPANQANLPSIIISQWNEKVPMACFLLGDGVKPSRSKSRSSSTSSRSAPSKPALPVPAKTPLLPSPLLWSSSESASLSPTRGASISICRFSTCSRRRCSVSASCTSSAACVCVCVCVSVCVRVCVG